MLTIRCGRCKAKVFKYNKIGTGRILRCHLDKIKDDFSERSIDEVLCPQCQGKIGTVSGRSIKMIQTAFTWSGTKIKK